MLNLPNSLTLIRILSIPFFLMLLSSRLYLEALMVFLVSGLTDALDGAVARLTAQQTWLGAYLDPVADKLLIGSSFVMLGAIGGIPPWFAVLVISRDVIILLGYASIYLLVSERLEVRPSIIGKCNTFFQLATVGAVLVVLGAPGLLPAALTDGLIAVTTVTTVASGLHYLYRGFVWLQNRAPSWGS
ncbi:MAG TPA: CDP-alcohol phosphatidyltransferase family protein [Candidatus Acidoferrales bacterium]|nr:CDP-alcohol phosphatidyltransferase family protein [Candidatus Acidoferrales bacterium]